MTSGGETGELQNNQQPTLTEASHETQDKNSETPILVTAGGKMCIFCSQEGHTHSNLQTPTEEIPPLLYRWSNIDSQGVNSRRFFQAGLFAEGTQYLDPHELTQGDFNKFVEAHVRIDKTLSPFISTFRMMLAPMHRALRNGEGAIVSIIDTRKLITPVYSAQKLIRTLKLKFRFYKGIAEYLVWGHIPNSAIICSFKASSFMKLARENPEVEDLLQFENIASFSRSGNALHRVLGTGPGGLNHQTGATIGRFLLKLEVPFEFCKTISFGMYKSWWMKARGGTLEEFYTGLESGYYSLNQVLDTPAIMTNTADEDEDEEMLDDESETSEHPELPGSSQQHQARREMPAVSEDQSSERPATPATPASPEANSSEAPLFPDMSDNADGSEESVFSGFSRLSEIFEFREDPIPENGPQSDEETVTDDLCASIDLFPAEDSLPPGPAVIKLFDGATKQWIQQGTYKDPLNGSSAETSIIIDDSDDEVIQITGSQTRGVKAESAVMIDLEGVSKKPIIVTNTGNIQPLSQRGSNVPASKPHDRFAADRARVLHFWG